MLQLMAPAAVGRRLITSQHASASLLPCTSSAEDFLVDRILLYFLHTSGRDRAIWDRKKEQLGQRAYCLSRMRDKKKKKTHPSIDQRYETSTWCKT